MQGCRVPIPVDKYIVHLLYLRLKEHFGKIIKRQKEDREFAVRLHLLWMSKVIPIKSYTIFWIVKTLF